MTDKKLETFKAADKQRPRIKSVAQTPQGQAAEPQSEGSVGFVRIEALLDHEMPGEVNKRLVSIIDQLDGLMADARSARDKAAPKRAKLAVERTMELVTFLFDTKANMAAQLGSKTQPARGAQKPNAETKGKK